MLHSFIKKVCEVDTEQYVFVTGRGFVTCDDLKKVFSSTAPRMPQYGIETAFR